MYNNHETVWENPTITSAFNAQSITVNCDKTVLYYEVIFAYTNSATASLGGTGKIKMGSAVTAAIAYHGTVKSRMVTASQNTTTGVVTLAFETGYSGTSAGTTNCVPKEIIFYYDESEDASSTSTILDSAAAILSNTTPNQITGCLGAKELFSELYSNLVWKLIGTTTGTATISFPATFNELCVEVLIVDQGNTVIYENSIIRNILTDTVKIWVLGSTAYSTTSMGVATVDITKTQGNLRYCVTNGVNISANVITKWYYR